MTIAGAVKVRKEHSAVAVVRYSRMASDDNVKVPGTRFGIVSYVSKMAHTCSHDGQGTLRLVPSYSMSAHATCPGALVESGARAQIAMPDVPADTLAGSQYNCDPGRCYAARTDSARDNVRAANVSRTEWTIESMRSAAGRREWESRMIEAYTLAYTFQSRQCLECAPMFRAHISGDFFSPQYVGSFRRVLFHLRATFPTLRAWLVTRSWHAANGALLRAAVASLATAAPDWLVVTASGLAVGQPVSAAQLEAAGMPPGMATNVVVRRADLARAVEAGFGACHAQGGAALGHACGPCTACWNGMPVAYSLH